MANERFTSRHTDNSFRTCNNNNLSSELQYLSYCSLCSGLVKENVYNFYVHVKTELLFVSSKYVVLIAFLIYPSVTSSRIASYVYVEFYAKGFLGLRKQS